MTHLTVREMARQRQAVRGPRAEAPARARQAANRARSLADRLREIRVAGRQPAAPLLRLRWAEARDGRGLVACWSEEMAQWLAPVTLHARRPAAPRRRAAGSAQHLPHPLTRLAAA